MANRVSPGSAIGSNPLLRSSVTINSTLDAVEDFQNTKRLGSPKAGSSMGVVVLAKANANIPAATCDSDGHVTPGTGAVTLVSFDEVSGKYKKIETLDSGIVHNHSGGEVTGGDYADAGTPIIYLIRVKNRYIIPFQGCGMPYAST